MLLTLDISVLRKKNIFSNWESHLMLAPEAFQQLSYNQLRPDSVSGQGK